MYYDFCEWISKLGKTTALVRCLGREWSVFYHEGGDSRVPALNKVNFITDYRDCNIFRCMLLFPTPNLQMRSCCTASFMSYGPSPCSHWWVYSGASNHMESWQLGVKGHTHRKPLRSNLSRNACLPNASLWANPQWKTGAYTTPRSNIAPRFQQVSTWTWIELDSFINGLEEQTLYLCSRHSRNTLTAIHTR